MLERLGLRYFRDRDARLDPVQPDDDIHYLNARERQDLRRIQWWSMARAATAGGLSAGLVAVAELYLLPAWGLSSDAEGWSLAEFYGVLLLLSGLTAVIEIAYLYYDALRSVHDLARAAGLNVCGPQQEEEVACALARAALELPDPRKPVFGVDPCREVSGWRLLLASVLYKAKIALSSFVLKALLRRALGRALVRSWLPFVAVPVTALWNLVICLRVLREARLRVMGPSAVQALLDETIPKLSEPAREVAMRSVAATIVKKHRLHPNHLVLLTEARRRLQVPDAPELDDPARFLDELQALSPKESQAVLQVFAAALVLDGRLSPRDRQLLKAVAERGPGPDLQHQVRCLRRAFVYGEGLSEAITATFPSLEAAVADPAPERV